MADLTALTQLEATDEVLRLPEGTTVDDQPDGRIRLALGPRRFAIGPLLPDVRAAVGSLAGTGTGTGAGTGATAAALTARAAGGEAVATQLHHVLARLSARGWIQRTLQLADVPLASLRPLGMPPGGGRPPRAAEGLVTLSRFAFVRRCGTELAVESPRTTAVVVLHDPRVATLIAWLARPVGAGELGAGVGDLPGHAALAVVELLAGAGLLVAVPSSGAGDEEQAAQALAQWSFADLIFHAASRYGRQAGGYGGTFPLQGRFAPLPARKPLVGHPVALTRPDMAALCAGDPPFSAVVERRRSVRQHDDDQPISIGQLGDFLYRSAGARPAPDGDGPGRRPYPSGGGLYELELYPVIGRCRGAEPGLYHYDPVDHRLGRVAGAGPEVQRLLDDAQGRSLMAATPQVLVVVAARFGRVMFKYEAIAYAVILKNVGALYQAMYGVATAMGLAPCALGGGSSDVFCAATGLDYHAESSVGEFLIGSSSAP